MDDASKRGPIGPSLVARLLLEASADPQLRVLFGMPQRPEPPQTTRHPALSSPVWHRHVAGSAAKDSKSNVVQFPVVARPQAFRHDAVTPMRRRARPKLPPKKT